MKTEATPKLTDRLVPLHARYVLGQDWSERWLAARLRLRDDRGDITPRMVGAALMAAAAIAVIGILRPRLETRATNLPLQ
jgi:hypothetical protein